MFQDLRNRLDVRELFAPATRTVNANSSSVDLQGYEGGLMLALHSAAGTGTVDIRLQDSADNAAWADVAGRVFAQVTTVASLQTMHVDSRAVRRHIRLASLAGGATPSHNFSAIAIGQRKVL